MTDSAFQSAQVLLDSLVSADDPARALMDSLVEATAARDPLLADLLQLAAVTRTFDLPLLALMAGRDAGDSQLSTAFQELTAMPFVRSQQDGSFRLHDAPRRALLESWSDDVAHRTRFAELNQRLAAHFEEAQERANDAGEALAGAGEVLQQVNPERWLSLQGILEDRLVRALVEALHHHAQDPQRGRAKFERWFERYEGEGRYGVAALLLRAWSDEVARVDGEQGKVLRDDVTYYQARLAQLQDDPERARRLAKTLTERDDADGQLRLRAQSTVTRSLFFENHFQEALASAQRELDMRATGDADEWNLPVVYQMRALIHRTLFDEDAEVAALRHALEASQRLENRGGEIGALTALSARLAEHGALDEAAEHAVRALHLARTDVDEDGAAPRAFATAAHMMKTFGQRDPRLAELFRAEAGRLVGGDDISQCVGLGYDYVAALGRTGQFPRAHDEVKRMERLAEKGSAADRAAVGMMEANLLDNEGRERAAVRRNLKALADLGERANAWDRAVTLTNAATTQMYIGELDDALTHASDARLLWTEMGHPRGVAITYLVEAEVSRRRAEYAGAAEALALAGEQPSSGFEVYRMATAADLAADQGELDKAAEQFHPAVARAEELFYLRSAAELASRRAAVLVRARRIEDAAAAGRRVVELLDRVRTLASFQLAPSQADADEHNARAVRLLAAPAGRRDAVLPSAQEHLEEAIRLDPEQSWYHLNLAYVHAAMRHAAEARDSLDAAVALAVGGAFAGPFELLGEAITPSG